MFYLIFVSITGEFRAKQTRPKQECFFNGSLPERLRGIPCVLQHWKTYIITLCMLWANLADDKLMLYIEFIIKIRTWHFMQIVFLGDNLHEVSNSFFFYRKIRKKNQNVVCWNVPSMQCDNWLPSSYIQKSTDRWIVLWCVIRVALQGHNIRNVFYYENMPIQILGILYHQNMKIFR